MLGCADATVFLVAEHFKVTERAGIQLVTVAMMGVLVLRESLPLHRHRNQSVQSHVAERSSAYPDVAVIVNVAPVERLILAGKSSGGIALCLPLH